MRYSAVLLFLVTSLSVARAQPEGATPGPTSEVADGDVESPEGLATTDGGETAATPAPKGPEAAPAIPATGEPAPDSPEAQLLWKRQQAATLQARIDETRRLLSAFIALPDTTFLPPAELEALLACGDLSDPQVGIDCAARLRSERTELASGIREHTAMTLALEQALLATAQPAPRRRRRNRTPADRDPSTTPAVQLLAQARVEYSRLEREALERKADLLLGEIAYLERSQPARARAHEERNALQRQLEEEEKRAEAERQRAEAARQRALAEQKQASSLAESVLRAEDARLEGIRRDQANFRKTIVSYRSEQNREFEGFQRFRLEQAGIANMDVRYDRLVLELDRLQRLTFGAQLKVWRAADHAPRPGRRLSKDVRLLPEQFASQKQALQDTLEELRRSARNLDAELAQRAKERAQQFYRQATALAQMRIELLSMISAQRREQLFDYSDETTLALQREFAHVSIAVLHWLELRFEQLRHATGVFSDLSLFGLVLWRFIEILIALLLLRHMLRRWDRWMLGATELIGTNLDLAGWALFLVRLLDFARSFAPPLLVLGVAEFIYRQLGAGDAVAEVRVIYTLVFWIALLRFQLRLLERVARQIGGWFADREARDDYENTEHDYSIAGIEAPPTDADGPGAKADASGPDAKADADADSASASGKEATPAGSAASSQPEDDVEGAGMGRARFPKPEPAFELLIQSWRALTGYATVGLIVLALIDMATGTGVGYRLVRTLLWWALLPLGIYCLRVWRPWIVREYVKRSPADGWLTEITKKHAPRFYGIFVLLLALIIVVARQVVRFVRSNLSDLDATKRLLAYLFRRRVEKHAQEHGRVLVKARELPKAITRRFPSGPLAPEDRPNKQPFLDEIKEAFDHWQEERVEGSVALVGGAGMGKSTGMRLLTVMLGEPVPVYKVVEKYTRPDELFPGLAELLQLPETPTSESGFVAALVAHCAQNQRRVLALDNCHNFFLRKVGGFAAWETFTRIVNRSSSDIFWVLSFNDVSWDYLRNIAGGVPFLRRIVRIPPWTDEELRRMILTRMRRAKYRTNFTDLLVTRLEGMNSSTQIIRTSQGYFRLLWDFTNGNPRVASHFWLCSLVPDEKKRRVRVHLFASPRMQELEQLPDDMAFVLAALVEHENITPDELATVSNVSIEFAHFALQYGRERGYMWRNPETRRTQLSTRWQQPIIRYLKRRHLLYS